MTWRFSGQLEITGLAAGEASASPPDGLLLPSGLEGIVSSSSGLTGLLESPSSGPEGLVSSLPVSEDIQEYRYNVLGKCG